MTEQTRLTLRQHASRFCVYLACPPGLMRTARLWVFARTFFLPINEIGRAFDQTTNAQ